MFDTRETIIQALEALGRHPGLAGASATVVVLAGRAAGILIGEIRTNTADCDVVAWPDGFSRSGPIEGCAQDIAKAHGLPTDWFNSECSLTSGWKLPPDYRDRWERVGRFGPLDVRCISRLDLIAMKMLATRDRDMRDLESLRPRAQELDWVGGFVATLKERFPGEAQTIDIAKARLLDMRKSPRAQSHED